MAARPRPPYQRIAVVVCDSVGCGEAPDARAFGDEGANTLGHVLQSTGVDLPNLRRLGLDRIPGVPLPSRSETRGSWGRMVETGPSKDTMIGHWELMGLVAKRPFPVYPEGFPQDVIGAFEAAIGRPVLGNRPASGTEILRELGDEHIASGSPIVYTSADSVFQVAAHEEVVPVEELYAMCSTARRILVGEHGVGRVIARPFVGDSADTYRRTARRRDFALPPPGPTALDVLVDAGLTTYGIGKIHDIFAGRGLNGWQKTADNDEGIDLTCAALRDGLGDLVFTNLVDFDSLYGHRRDPRGYAEALAAFDARLPEILGSLGPRDVLIVTADHGNDPTWHGTDHTRECVPLLVAGDAVQAVDLGTRATFCDLGATVLDNFAIDPLPPGKSFLSRIS